MTSLAYRENVLRIVSVTDTGCLFKLDLAKCPLHVAKWYSVRAKTGLSFLPVKTVYMVEGLYCRCLAARAGDRTTEVVDPQAEEN